MAERREAGKNEVDSEEVDFGRKRVGTWVP